MKRVTIFTEGRRIWLANTFKNIIFLVIAAAFASKFFADFSGRFRLISIITLILLFILGFIIFILGFIICPDIKGDE